MHDDPRFSYRGNLIAAVDAETLWAVRVLRSAGGPNECLECGTSGLCFGASSSPSWATGDSNMDLLWAWIQAMQDNSTSGSPLHFDPRMNEKATARNLHPADLVGAMNMGHKFKMPWPWDPASCTSTEANNACSDIYGLDNYIKGRVENPKAQCITPTGKAVLLRDRSTEARSRWYFQKRGRITMPEAGSHRGSMLLRYEQSGYNRHAGITESEHIRDEAKDVFPRPVSHGKNLIARDDSESSLAGVFRALHAPFVGAASGSIQQFVVSMEDNGAGAFPDGLVPFQAHRVREALIGLQTMTLVSGGQHSIAECLLVAQDMGYFQQLPYVLDSYVAAVAAFERHSAGLGIMAAPGVGPLSELEAKWDALLGLGRPDGAYTDSVDSRECGSTDGTSSGRTEGLRHDKEDLILSISQGQTEGLRGDKEDLILSASLGETEGLRGELILSASGQKDGPCYDNEQLVMSD